MVFRNTIQSLNQRAMGSALSTWVYGKSLEERRSSATGSRPAGHKVHYITGIIGGFFMRVCRAVPSGWATLFKASARVTQL